jgi:hypothetical protein
LVFPPVLFHPPVEFSQCLPFFRVLLYKRNNFYNYQISFGLISAPGSESLPLRAAGNCGVCAGRLRGFALSRLRRRAFLALFARSPAFFAVSNSRESKWLFFLKPPSLIERSF